MMRRSEKLFAFFAVILTVIFLWGIAGFSRRAIGREPGGRQYPYFHEGKSVVSVPKDPVCQAPACHDLYPHTRNAGWSVFNNMHHGIADCLACHGKDAARQWTAGASRQEDGSRIRSLVPRAKGNPHESTGPAEKCRRCHSESGKAKLLEIGVSGLSSGFADPMALRMMEGGANRWTPADLR